MVLSSLIVVAFSLLPFVFHRYGLGDVAVWRVLSALFAVAALTDAGWLIRNVIAISHDLPTRRPIVIVFTIPIPTLAIATLLLASNAVLVPPSFTAAVYLTGLGLFLFLAGFTFALVLFSLGHDRSDA